MFLSTYSDIFSPCILQYGSNCCNRLSGVSVGLPLLLIFLLEGNTSMGLMVVL
jgi:hypothetical protein